MARRRQRRKPKAKRLLWTMGQQSQLFLLVASLAGLYLLSRAAPVSAYYVISAYLVGTSVGLAFGVIWRHLLSRYWRFYSKFYHVKTPNRVRAKMYIDRLRYEWSTFTGAVLVALVLFRTMELGMWWFSTAFLLGFTLGGALALFVALRELK